jgi:hypothetical protein
MTNNDTAQHSHATVDSYLALKKGAPVEERSFYGYERFCSSADPEMRSIYEQRYKDLRALGKVRNGIKNERVIEVQTAFLTAKSRAEKGNTGTKKRTLKAEVTDTTAEITEAVVSGTQGVAPMDVVAADCAAVSAAVATQEVASVVPPTPADVSENTSKKRQRSAECASSIIGESPIHAVIRVGVGKQLSKSVRARMRDGTFRVERMYAMCAFAAKSVQETAALLQGFVLREIMAGSTRNVPAAVMRSVEQFGHSRFTVNTYELRPGESAEHFRLRKICVTRDSLLQYCTAWAAVVEITARYQSVLSRGHLDTVFLHTWLQILQSALTDPLPCARRGLIWFDMCRFITDDCLSDFFTSVSMRSACKLALKTHGFRTVDIYTNTATPACFSSFTKLALLHPLCIVVQINDRVLRLAYSENYGQTNEVERVSALMPILCSLLESLFVLKSPFVTTMTVAAVSHFVARVRSCRTLGKSSRVSLMRSGLAVQTWSNQLLGLVCEEAKLFVCACAACSVPLSPYAQKIPLTSRNVPISSPVSGWVDFLFPVETVTASRVQARALALMSVERNFSDEPTDTAGIQVLTTVTS